MTDPETAAAVEALAHRLRNRDPEVDAEVFALEFITALRGRGWRVTEAKAKPDPHTPGSGLPQREDAVAAVAELKARFAAAVSDPQDEAS